MAVTHTYRVIRWWQGGDMGDEGLSVHGGWIWLSVVAIYVEIIRISATWMMIPLLSFRDGTRD